MEKIRFYLIKESFSNTRFPYIQWDLYVDEELLLRIYTMQDGREITCAMAAHGIRPLRNCRRWPMKRDTMLRLMKKELAIQAASHDNPRIEQDLYEFLKYNYKKLFKGDDYDI